MRYRNKKYIQLHLTEQLLKSLAIIIPANKIIAIKDYISGFYYLNLSCNCNLTEAVTVRLNSRHRSKILKKYAEIQENTNCCLFDNLKKTGAETNALQS